MKLKFTAKKFIENDCSVTLSLQEMDIIENAETETIAKIELANAILEYAADFFKDYAYWVVDKKRKKHIPYVLKVKDMNVADITLLIKII